MKLRSLRPLGIVGTVLLGCTLGLPGRVLAAATIAHPTHPEGPGPVHSVQRPPRPPQPTRIPRPPRLGQDTPTPQPTVTPTATPTASPTPTTAAGNNTPTTGNGGSCPGVPVTCPAVPACTTGDRFGKLFYAYPSRERNLVANGFFQLNASSNGIDPANESGSLAMVDISGSTFLQMKNLQFVPAADGSFTATNEQGLVTIAPALGGYSFRFEFDNPPLPPGFFSVAIQLCMSIGDDGMYEQIVCQQKPNNGFLCHSNGPTL